MLAVVLPLLLVTVAAWAITRPHPEEASDRAAAMDLALAEVQPEVVFIGNSSVGAGVDADALGQLLGASVFKAHQDATTAATWYLVLKNRVFGQGLRPKLVVAGSYAGAIMKVGPPGALERDALLDHATGHEPALWRLTFGRESQPRWVMDGDRRRRALRSEVLGGVRELSSELAGAEDVDAALEAVFGGEEATDEDLRTRVLPVVDVREREAARPAGDLSATDGYVDEIVALCAEYGAQVVFVRFPVRPGNIPDAVTPEDLRTLVSHLNEAGAGWIDLSAIDLGVQHYKDRLHLNARGQALFTARLAGELQDLGALASGALRRSWVVQATPLQRSGQLPPLEPLQVEQQEPCLLTARMPGTHRLGMLARLAPVGLEEVLPLELTEDGQVLELQRAPSEHCSGAWRLAWRLRIHPRALDEGPPPLERSYTMRWRDEPVIEDESGRRWTWLLPGTVLTTRLDAEVPDGDEPVRLQARLLRLASDTALPQLAVDGQPVAPVAPDHAQVHFDHALLQRSVDGLEVALSLPPDAAPVLVESVRLVSGAQSGQVVGTRAQALPGYAGYQGRRTDPVKFASDPAPVKHRPPTLRQDGLLVFELDGMAAVDGRYAGRAVRRSGWTPVQLLLDGVPVERAPIMCRKLAEAPAGSWCHSGNELWVKPPAGVQPERYGLRLDPERSSTGKRLLYPGDEVKLIGSIVERAAISGGASRLRLDARPMVRRGGDPKGSLEIEVGNSKTTYLRAELPLAELGQEPVVLDFAQPAEPLTAPPVSLRLGQDASFLLLASVGLDEGEGSVLAEGEGDGEGDTGR